MDDAAIVGVWERARPLDPLRREILLAADAVPVIDPAEAADLPIGEYRRRLLRLREEWARGPLEATVICPGCGAFLEFSLDASRILEEATTGTVAPIEIGNRLVHWRLLTGSDLLAAADEPDVSAAERELLARCVVAVEHGRTHLTDAPLDVPERTALSAALADADPLSEVTVHLECVECGERHDAHVPVGDLVWGELDTVVRELFADVDVLARTYGWTEADCLALSQVRRRRYVDLASTGAV